MNEFREEHTEAECQGVFEKLFPQGFAASDVRNELALDKLRCVAGEDGEATDRDLGELVGRCVWDIFSDQNEVIAQDGRVIHLGTLRGAGDFLAEFSKRQTGRREFDYMSFYLGTSAPWAETEDDLTQIYELVFHRLKRRELDWVYHFPRIHLVDFQPLREALDSKDKPEWTDYSPSDAFAKGAADQQREREIAEFRDHLEADRNAAIEEALQKPAPSRVCAYRNVFGSWPTGWPPSPGD